MNGIKNSHLASFLLTLISFFGWPVCAFFMFSMIKNVRLEQATDLMHTGKTFFQNGEYTKSQDYFSRSLNIINEDFVAEIDLKNR